MSLLFFLLGENRQSILVNLKQFFNLTHGEKYQLLNTTFIELESNSSRAQVLTNVIQNPTPIDILICQNETLVQQDLQEAVEMIRQTDSDDGMQELMEQDQYQYEDQTIITRLINDTPSWQQLPQQHIPTLHPLPRPIYSCIICSKKSIMDQTPLILREHPINFKGKLLREACPVLVNMTMKERQDLLVRLKICLACLTCSLEDITHGPETCKFPYTNIICNEPNCFIRKTVCNAHKGINQGMLIHTNQIYQQLGLGLIIT